MFRREGHNALANSVPDLANDLKGLAFGVPQRPIEFFEARNVRARIAVQPIVTT